MSHFVWLEFIFYSIVSWLLHFCPFCHNLQQVMQDVLLVKQDSREKRRWSQEDPKEWIWESKKIFFRQWDTYRRIRDVLPPVESLFMNEMAWSHVYPIPHLHVLYKVDHNSLDLRREEEPWLERTRLFRSELTPFPCTLLMLYFTQQETWKAVGMLLLIFMLFFTGHISSLSDYQSDSLSHCFFLTFLASSHLLSCWCSWIF